MKIFDSAVKKYIFFSFLLIFCFQQQMISEDKSELIRVELTVESKDKVTADRADVFLRRGLNSLNYVLVTDEKADLAITVKIMKIEKPYGYFVSFIIYMNPDFLSALDALSSQLREEFPIVRKTLPYSKIANMISSIEKELESDPKRKKKFYEENRISMLLDFNHAMGPNLQELCEKLVEYFDSSHAFKLVKETKQKTSTELEELEEELRKLREEEKEDIKK